MSLSNKFLFRPVEIFWADSEHMSDWSKLSDVLEEQEGSLECRSCGYLIADREDRVILATSVSADEDTEEMISAYLTIPKSAITKMSYLRKK